MAASIDAPKIAPRDVAARHWTALEAGVDEVLADEVTRGVKAGLAGQPMAFPAG